MISGIAIALMLLLFGAVTGWAWSREKQRDFADAAALALVDDVPSNACTETRP